MVFCPNFFPNGKSTAIECKLEEPAGAENYRPSKLLDRRTPGRVFGGFSLTACVVSRSERIHESHDMTPTNRD